MPTSFGDTVSQGYDDFPNKWLWRGRSDLSIPTKKQEVGVRILPEQATACSVARNWQSPARPGMRVRLPPETAAVVQLVRIRSLHSDVKRDRDSSLACMGSERIYVKYAVTSQTRGAHVGVG